jgi:LysM domain
MFPKIILALATLALVVGMAARPSGGTGRMQVYIVKPTDTLWSIAVAHTAGDPREGIWNLERRNHLAGTTLVPGQRLVLP